MMVTTNAIVRDVFSGIKSAKVYSYINGVIGFSPLFAPLVGGFIDLHFGWRYIFVFTALLGVCNLSLVLLAVNETLSRNKRKPFNFSLFLRYFEVIKHPQFLLYGLSAAFGLSYLFTFFAISSFLLIKSCMYQSKCLVFTLPLWAVLC